MKYTKILDDKATMWLDGEISKSQDTIGINGKEFSLELIDLIKNKSIKDITININSEGGDVDALFPILEAIQSSNKPITTHVYGVACSCAALLSLYGDKRTMTNYASKMFHPPWVENDKLTPNQQQMLDIYEKQLKRIVTNKDNKINLNYLFQKGKDKWYLADECLNMGLVDDIIGDVIKDYLVDKIIILNKAKEYKESLDTLPHNINNNIKNNKMNEKLEQIFHESFTEFVKSKLSLKNELPESLYMEKFEEMRKKVDNLVKDMDEMKMKNVPKDSMESEKEEDKHLKELEEIQKKEKEEMKDKMDSTKCESKEPGIYGDGEIVEMKKEMDEMKDELIKDAIIEDKIKAEDLITISNLKEIKSIKNLRETIKNLKKLENTLVETKPLIQNGIPEWLREKQNQLINKTIK